MNRNFPIKLNFLLVNVVHLRAIMYRVCSLEIKVIYLISNSDGSCTSELLAPTQSSFSFEV